MQFSGGLSKSLSGASRRWKVNADKEQISSYEADFLTGIETQEVYQLYQPIFNSLKEIRGFEILIRWKQHGETLKPDEFIPRLKSEKALLLLTAMCIKKAIDGINHCQGRYFFCVNIHSQLGGCSGLMKMCAEACRQLKDLQWKKQLVLEFSVKSDNYKSSDMVDTLNSLRNMGVILYLDDCFSDGSIFFPVRKFSYDGYKLDKSIVDNILASHNDMALVSSLSGYCSLTERRCIAEGIEDIFTFEKLKNLGIELFQGYFFHRPCNEEEMLALILKSPPSSQDI